MLAPLFLTLIAISTRPAFAQAGHQDHSSADAFVIFSAAAAVCVAFTLVLRMWRMSRHLAIVSALAFTVTCAGVVGIHTALEQTPFARHMLEQMLLMDVIAPITAVIVVRWVRVTPAWAAMAHAAVMWGWHIPPLYAWTTALPGLHIAMELSFLLVGVTFWASVLRAKGSRTGRALFWLFMTVMHTGFLGALLTFTEIPLYGAAIEDQQLGGAVMWVMGTAVYAAAGLLVAARWFHVIERGSLQERTT